MKNLVILGSTGSVGTQTLEVVAAFPDQFSILGLSGGNKMDLLQTQITSFRPKWVCVKTADQAKALQTWAKNRGLPLDIVYGDAGLIHIATLSGTHCVVVALSGTVALRPTYAALKAGIPIGLACKEVLVAAGQIMMALASKKQVPILPLDSEHAALFQCLGGATCPIQDIATLAITASGGPFRQRDARTFNTITREEALNHPKWNMGPKITIDSATMMNKGLEVIEAHHLFQIPFKQIAVLVHPQSIVHGLVEFSNGTWLSQMGLPDMRFPIQYALMYPQKIATPWPKMSLKDMASLTFEEPRLHDFPLLQFSFEVGLKGGSAPAVMNAANEAAVALFLDKKIGFVDISACVRTVTESTPYLSNPSFEDIVSLDHDIKQKVIKDYA